MDWRISWRLRLYTILLTWILLFALNMWALAGRHYLLQLPIGVLTCPVGASVMMKLSVGRWPDWRAVWRLFTGKDKI